MGKAEKVEATAEMVYVVQKHETVDVVTGWTGDEKSPTQEPVIERQEWWADIATVKVPARTKRATVLKRALAEAGIKPDAEPPKLRALDADSAEVHEPEGHQPPMEWRL